jgi:excisionase family DNA binding protein
VAGETSAGHGHPLTKAPDHHVAQSHAKAGRGSAPISAKPTSASPKPRARTASDIAAPRDVPDPDTGLERLLTVAEVADLLRLSVRQVRRMTASGALPIVPLGAAVRIRPSVIAALIARGDR